MDGDTAKRSRLPLTYSSWFLNNNKPFKKVSSAEKVANKIKYVYFQGNICSNRNRVTEPNSDTYLGIKTKKFEIREGSGRHLRKNSLNFKTLKNNLSSHKIGKSRTIEKSAKCHQNILKNDERKHAKKESGNSLSSAIFSETKCHKTNPSDLFGFRRCNRRRQNFDYNMSVIYKMLGKDSHHDVLRCRHCSFEDVAQENSKKKSPLPKCISEVPTRYTLINFSQCSTSTDTFTLKPEGLNQTKPKKTVDASSSLSISNTNKSILKKADSVKSVYTQPMRIKTKQRKLATMDYPTRRSHPLRTTVGNMFYPSKRNCKCSKHGLDVKKSTSSNKTRKGVRVSLKPLPFLKTFINHILSLVVVIVWLPCIVIIGFFWLISYPFRPHQNWENLNYKKQFHTQSDRNKNKRYSNRSKSNSRTKSPSEIIPFNISVHSHKKNMKCKVKLRKKSARKQKCAKNKTGARFFYSATTALAFPGEGFQPCNTKKKKKSVTFEDSFENCDAFFPKDDLEGSFICPEGRFELQSRFGKDFPIPTDANYRNTCVPEQSKKEEAQLDCRKYLEQKSCCEQKRRQFEVGIPKIIPKLIKSTLCQNSSANNYSNLKQLPKNEKNYGLTNIELAKRNNDCNQNIEDRSWSNSPACSEEFSCPCPTQNYSPPCKKRSLQKSVQASTGKSTTVIKFFPLPSRKIKKEKPTKKIKDGPKKLKQSKDASNKKKSSKEGTKKQKPSKDGKNINKSSKEGTKKKKPSKDATKKQKPPKDRSKKQKPSKDGSKKQKPSKDGSKKQKPSKDGTKKQKSSKDKTNKKKSSKEGSDKQKVSKDKTNKQKRLKDKKIDKKRQKIKSTSVLKFFPSPRPRMRSVSSNVSLPNSPSQTKYKTQTSSTNTSIIKTTSVIKFFPAPKQDHKASCKEGVTKASATNGLKALKQKTISTVTPFINKTTSVIKFFPSPCRNKHVQFHESKSSELFKSSRLKANERSSSPSKTPMPPKTTTVVKFFPAPQKSRDETSTSCQPLSCQTKTVATDAIGFTSRSRKSTCATNTDICKILSKKPTSIIKFFPPPQSSRRTSSADNTKSDLLKKTQVSKITSRSDASGKEKNEKSEKSEKAKRIQSKKTETCKATQVIKFFPEPRPKTRTSVVKARPIEADNTKSGRKTPTSVIKFFPSPRYETRSLTTSTHTYQKTKKIATNMPTSIIKFFRSPQKSSGSLRSSFLGTKSTKDKIKKTDWKSKYSSDKSKKEKERAKAGDGDIYSVRKYYLRKKRTRKPIADSTCREKKVKRIKSKDKLASSKSCKIKKKAMAKKEPIICCTRKKKDKKNLDYETGQRIRSVRKYYLEKLPISPMPVCTTCPMCQTKNAILKGSSPGSSLRGDKKSHVKKKGTQDEKFDKGKKRPGKSKTTQNNFAASVIKYIPPRRIRKRTITVNTPIKKIKSRRTQSQYPHDLKPKLVDKKKNLRRRKLKRCLLSKLRKGEIDDFEVDETKKKRRVRFGKVKNMFVKFVDTQTQGLDEATCNITGSQKRPCQWIYDHFPSLYPAFLVLYKVYNNTVHVFFFLLAAIIWCPLFCWCFLFYFVIFRRLLCS